MDVPITFAAANWTAPPLNQLDFSSNCSLVAAFARSWFDFDQRPGINFRPTVDYFRNVLPANLRNVPTDGQVIDWFRSVMATAREELDRGVVYNESNPNPWYNVTSNAFKACVTEVCMAVSWSGVPDITGPGVMASAWIQALLACVFALVALWARRFDGKKATPSARQQLVIDMSDATLDIFVKTGMMLSLCIGFGTIALMAQKSKMGDGTQVSLARDMCVYSVAAFLFPDTVSAVMRHKPMLSTKRFGIVLLAVGGNYLVTVFSPLANKFETVESWELYCSWSSVRAEGHVTYLMLIAILTVVMIASWVLGRIGLAKYQEGTFLVASGLVMWWMLISVTVIRELLLRKSGYQSEDLRWTFGQVLSLGTWLPVFVEMLYVWRSRGNISKVYQERVPQGWSVAKSPASQPGNSATKEGVIGATGILEAQLGDGYQESSRANGPSERASLLGAATAEQHDANGTQSDIDVERPGPTNGSRASSVAEVVERGPETSVATGSHGEGARLLGPSGMGKQPGARGAQDGTDGSIELTSLPAPTRTQEA